MGMKITAVSAILFLALICEISCSIIDSRCFPGQTCWPDSQAIFQFITSLKGKVYQPSNSEYYKYNTYINVRYHRSPAFLVFVEGVNDVIKCMKFAKKYNILVTIKSSGHSYNGRYTHDGSLQINMKEMKYRNVILSSQRSKDGEIKVETGNTWNDLYQEVQKYDRVILGGSDPTVTPGGYTQGGGHSPVSRSLGLAVDHLLEVELIDADGRLVIARENETLVTNDDDTVMVIDNGDLLWAIRGGGGGVWGVIINYTFRLHKQPNGFVKSSHSFAFITNDTVPGAQTLKDLFRIIKNLPPQWGGYVLLNNFKQAIAREGDWGYIHLSLIHYGGWNSSTRPDIDNITDYTLQQIHEITNLASFWDYAKGGSLQTSDIPQPVYRSYLANGFLQKNETHFDSWVDSISDTMLKNKGSIGCTGTLLGGKVDVTNPATSVSPEFRSAMMAMSCYTTWVDPEEDDKWIQLGRELNEALTEYGRGVYYNEPSYYLPEWKDEFWGGHYERLLAIKRRWDPDNFLWCYHCVGSDLPSSPMVQPVPCAGNHGYAVWPVVVSLATLATVFKFCY